MKRGGPLKRYTPLRSASGLRSTATKRARPAQGFPPKVEHDRMKPKPGREPTAAEARVHKAIREEGCEKCGGEAEIHHILHAPETDNQRCHELVVALCPACHRYPYPGSVHTLGSEAAFRTEHGVDLLAAARRNRVKHFVMPKHGLTTADKLEAAE